LQRGGRAVFTGLFCTDTVELLGILFAHLLEELHDAGGVVERVELVVGLFAKNSQELSFGAVQQVTSLLGIRGLLGLHEEPDAEELARFDLTVELVEAGVRYERGLEERSQQVVFGVSVGLLCALEPRPGFVREVGWGVRGIFVVLGRFVLGWFA
jgi:hypothetical protein